MGRPRSLAVRRLLLEGVSKKSKAGRMTRLTRTQLQDYIRGIDAASYSQQRNYLGSSTRLSEYTTRGSISLPDVRQLLLETNSPESAYKLINELAWREYWQLVWRSRGDGIFEYIRPLRQTVRAGIPEAILNATTGIEVIDNSIRQLKSSGYIHNHERLWLAGLVCNVAHCDWKIGADWMHSQLIDGDFASNHLSWQWVAGSYTGKPYLPQQQNINSYSRTVQNNTYLDVSYEALSDMAIPGPLQKLDTTQSLTDVRLPTSTISLQALQESSEILLYSPWTLDPSWRTESAAVRVLLFDNDWFTRGNYTQNVIDSIVWFAEQIPDLSILCAEPSVLAGLTDHITRKPYPGIANWPGRVDRLELLFPGVPDKLYNSFSAFWKQTQKRPVRDPI